MYKRCVILFACFMGFICLAFFRLDCVSNKTNLRDAAVSQQSYALPIAVARGTIYDCRRIPLVNNKKNLVAAVIPCVEALSALTPVTAPEKASELYKKCSGKTPFITEITRRIESPYVKIFEISIRYTGVTLAPHIIGYLSAEREGLCGIEKAYNSHLSADNKKICVKYSVDATGKMLPGKKEIAEDRSYLNSRGVILNMDSRIQAITEETANKYISRGAVIVSQVPDCKIRACASFPSFLPGSVENYLNDKNSPLLNRAFCSFNLGSVFKLITSAAALENGISENTLYNCEGINHVEDADFKCFNSIKHETVNMEQALAHSCNGYFIELIKKIPENALLKTAQKFRLGTATPIAPGLDSSSGCLPLPKSLQNIKTLANFSFGQGKLMATPIQIAAVINAIASGGIYSAPKLVQDVVDDGMKPIKGGIGCNYEAPERVISETTSVKIKSHMKASVDYGTAQKGKPDDIEAAAKTSTAQTGIIEDGKKIEQSWFAGFFPYDKPEYCIVILSEAGRGGGESCGPVFKEIVTRMTKEIPEIFIK